MIQLFHNPRCGKSRACFEFLTQSKIEFEVVKYLETPPTVDELKEIIKKIGISPLEIVRKKEKVWIEKYRSKSLSDPEILEALSENPILIERPIVITNEKAVIARPFELAKSIL